MLHVQDFTIKKDSRLNEFLEFKNQFLPNTQFRHEPKYCQKNGYHKISISSKLSDIPALESLFQKWNAEDEAVDVRNLKVTLIDKLLVRLRA